MREPESLRDTSASSSPTEVYRARVDRFQRASAALDRTSARFANSNVALFGGAAVSTAIGIWRGGVWWYGLAAVLLIAFAIGYRRHGQIDQQLRRARALMAVNVEGLARIQRDWAALPLRGDPSIPPDHPFAGDLDILGQASLQHVLSSATTPAGQDRVKAMLLEPAEPAEILRRQAAVRELAPLIDWRDEIQARGRSVGDTRHGYLRIAEWAEAAPWLATHPWIVWYARISAPLTILLLIAQLNGAIHFAFWLLLGFVNLAISLTVGREASARVDAIAERYEVFAGYAAIFDVIVSREYQAPLLRDLRERFVVGGQSAGGRMRRLGWVMPWATMQRWYFFPIIQALTLWNFHILAVLEAWQRDAGPHVRDWLAALGDAEALAALAALTYDQPQWSFPRVALDVGTRFAGREVGHPLLASVSCVGNDVAVGPPGSFLLVTGSNMSGKSTLLRAIGTNVVLAQMGAPVCATALEMPPLDLATSMRIRDSLEEGVSYFMAELRRLKLVVDTVDAASAPGRRPVLYLLDEILHGTNTRERQIAARAIIRHLLTMPAIGAVSTHDLTLADDADLASASIAVHFTETFSATAGQRVMHFDYQLRPGLATSSNALALMEMVGLPMPTATEV